jgi:hypothetical protein
MVSITATRSRFDKAGSPSYALSGKAYWENLQLLKVTGFEAPVDMQAGSVLIDFTKPSPEAPARNRPARLGRLRGSRRSTFRSGTRGSRSTAVRSDTAALASHARHSGISRCRYSSPATATPGA